MRKEHRDTAALRDDTQEERPGPGSLTQGSGLFYVQSSDGHNDAKTREQWPSQLPPPEAAACNSAPRRRAQLGDSPTDSLRYLHGPIAFKTFRAIVCCAGQTGYLGQQTRTREYSCLTILTTRVQLSGDMTGCGNEMTTPAEPLGTKPLPSDPTIQGITAAGIIAIAFFPVATRLS
jgi:hypothetical protein